MTGERLQSRRRIVNGTKRVLQVSSGPFRPPNGCIQNEMPADQTRRQEPRHAETRVLRGSQNPAESPEERKDRQARRATEDCVYELRMQFIGFVHVSVVFYLANEPRVVLEAVPSNWVLPLLSFIDLFRRV